MYLIMRLSVTKTQYQIYRVITLIK